MTEAHDIPLEENRDLDEETLVKGLVAGDLETVRDFLRRTHRPLYAMTTRLTTDPDLRHDWCQDILLKIVKEMGSGRFVYRHPGCFWSWFRTRARFLLIDACNRHRKHRARQTAGEVGDDLVNNMPQPRGSDPQRILEAVEARRVVEECLENLDNEDHRRALQLHLMQDLPYDEVAGAMDATLNTVRSWIRRGRVAVRHCVAAKFQYSAGKDS